MFLGLIRVDLMVISAIGANFCSTDINAFYACLGNAYSV